ncbi:MAG: ABC transporter permease [Alistipes sp.]|nr:ABC transporter permease [Alistipes sp.]
MKWRFAIRYLTARKSHSVINVIASVSLLAVVVPVAAMVILLSVFNGFESLVRDLYKVVDADIEIRATEGRLLIDEQICQEVGSVEGVEAYSFMVERQALLRYRDRYTTVLLRGVDENYNNVFNIRDYTSVGSADVWLGDIDRVMVGEGVAYDLGIYAIGVNDVEVISLGGASVGSLIPTSGMRGERMPLCGTFLIDSEHDSSMALTSLRAMSRLFDCEGRADVLLVKVGEGRSPQRVREALAESISQPTTITLREEKNESFYAIMRYEKWGVFFISLLVLVVASLSIIGTVIMLIVEKRDERLTLYSLGADHNFIRGVFIREGLLISGVGGIIGVVIGVAVVLVQQYYGIVKMPNGNFLIENYPVELQGGDLVVIVAAFMAVAAVVSMAATYTMIKRNS